MSRLFGMAFSRVYPLYLTKVERKGRSQAELDTVIRWLLDFDDATLAKHLAVGTTFEQLFAGAAKITGVICGMRVEEIEDPLMQKIRYLDKVVDELAHGKALEKILRA
jgi:hypothetical protein